MENLGDVAKRTDEEPSADRWMAERDSAMSREGPVADRWMAGRNAARKRVVAKSEEEPVVAWAWTTFC